MVTAQQHQHQQPDCDHHSSENEFNDNDNINDENDESLEAARADVELLQAAYPDEIESITTDAEKDAVRFPLTVRLHFSKTTSCELQWREGYPDESTVEIVSWRIKDARERLQREARHHLPEVVAIAERVADEDEVGEDDEREEPQEQGRGERAAERSERPPAGVLVAQGSA